jgi:serine/threonine-protein kinase
MDTDHNLLFGVLALQGDLIDSSQFAEACTAWAVRKDRALADVLSERGWISSEDVQVVERLIERKLKKHSGSAHKSLADSTARDAGIHATVAKVRDAVDDAEIRRTLSDLTPATRGTVEYVARLDRTEDNRGRYTLSSLHAKGGTGQVWLARDTELDREVALKELRPEHSQNTTSLRRFLQEARVTSQLDHPGVVPIYELARGSEPAQHPYYTMRLIRGRTLSSAISDYHRKRSEGQAKRVELLSLVQAFLGVCQTVAFAHSRGVIHRDLKGLNIVLGEFGEVVLLDWGLAKLMDRPGTNDEADDDPAATGAWPGAGTLPAADPEMTAAGQALGTPGYMAPEQAEGRLNRISRRTDVYGLGAILYEILTDRPPFEAPSIEEVLRQVREQSPQPPRHFWKKVPRPLEAICLTALAKNPDDRFASVTDLASDVQHWLANEPVSAYREPWIVRVQRWISRNRTLVAAGAAALIVAAGALGTLAVTEARANRDLTAALARELSARDDALAQEVIAREAIQSFYSGISEDVMLRRPELEGLRRRLLGSALSFYEKLGRALEASSGSAKSPLRVRDLARAFQRIASIQALLGNKDQAIEARRKVVALYDALPSEPSAAADALIDLGNAQRLAGHPDDALGSLREALERFERLNIDAVVDGKVALASADLGRLLSDLGQVDEAERALERAREIQEALIKTASRRETFQQNLSATYTSLGNLFANQQRTDQALHAYELANRIYEDMVARNPKGPYTEAELARTLNNLGLARARSGRIVDGQRDIERGLKIRAELLADQPLNIEYRSDLGRSYFHLAMVQVRAGAPAEALKSIAKAEELYAGIPPKGAEDIYFQACLKGMRTALLAGGKPDAELSPAQRSERLRNADEALQRLKQAVTAGYRPAALFRHDPSLDSLRARPDFQELLRAIDNPPAGVRNAKGAGEH